MRTPDPAHLPQGDFLASLRAQCPPGSALCGGSLTSMSSPHWCFRARHIRARRCIRTSCSAHFNIRVGRILVYLTGRPLHDILSSRHFPHPVGQMLGKCQTGGSFNAEAAQDAQNSFGPRCLRPTEGRKSPWGRCQGAALPFSFTLCESLKLSIFIETY